MSAVNSKVLFFLAAAVATDAELAAINRLQTVYREVKVCDGSVADAAKYGSGLLESFDFLAGTIPTAYSSVEGAVTLTVPSSVAPDQFKVLPAAVSIDASNVDVQQLAAVKSVIDPATGLATMTDLAAHASVVWTSSDETKATVGADGLVTAVAAGTTNVTATLTAGTPVTGITGEADTELLTKAAHGFKTGDYLKLTALTGGTGLTVNTLHFAIVKSVDTLQLASSLANAVAGTAEAFTADISDATLVPAPVTAVCAVTVIA